MVKEETEPGGQKWWIFQIVLNGPHLLQIQFTMSQKSNDEDKTSTTKNKRKVILQWKADQFTQSLFDNKDIRKITLNHLQQIYENVPKVATKVTLKIWNCRCSSNSSPY